MMVDVKMILVDITSKVFKNLFEKTRRSKYLARIPIAQIMFWIGFSVFLLAHIYLVLRPISVRLEPIEVDDSYSYMAKSVVMAVCFSSSCPALESLQQQIQGGSYSDQVAFWRNRIDLNLFTYYHPVYSLLFNAIHSAGLGLVQTYNLLYVFFGILICAAIGYWLLAIWGPGPSGIALGLLSFYTFSGQGLNVFVPSNMALGIAIVSWTIILRDKRSLFWCLPLLWVASIGMHTIGLLYGLVGMGLIALSSGWPLHKKTRGVLIFGGVVLLARFALPYLVPAFKLTSSSGDFYLQNSTFAEQILSNVEQAAEFIKRWALSYWSYYVVGFFLIVGFLASPKENQRRIILTGSTLATLFVLSLVYYSPSLGSPADRIWIPLALFLTGAVGNFLYRWLLSSAFWLKHVFDGSSIRLPATTTILSARGWVVALLMFTGLVLSQSLATYLTFSARDYKLTLNNSITRQDLFLGDSIVPELLTRLESRDAILYMDEIPLYYAFANGLLWNETVFFPAISGTEKVQSLIIENSNLLYLLAMDPLSSIPGYVQGALTVGNGDRIVFVSSSNLDLSSAELFFENPGEEMTVTLEYETGGETIIREMVLQGEADGWLAIAKINQPINEITIRGDQGDGVLMLRGLRLEDTALTNWPWDKGLSVIYSNEEESLAPIAVSFETKHIQEGLGLHVDILSDKTSIILAKIDR